MAKEALSSVSILPTDKDIEAISPIIEDLAKKYGTSPFIPHITIWGNVIAPLNEVEEAVRSAIEGIRPFSVEIEKLDQSARWSKTLFAQIQQN